MSNAPGKVPNNALNNAFNRIGQLANRVGRFTESQKDFGGKVDAKAQKLQDIIRKLQNCREQIRALRADVQDCNERLNAQRAAAEGAAAASRQDAAAAIEAAKRDAKQACRDESAGQLNAAAQRFEDIANALEGIGAQMQTIDNLNLGELERQVDEICGAAGGKTYSNAVSGNESENNRVNRGKMASGKYPGSMSNSDFPPLRVGYRYGKAGKVGRKTRRKNKGKRRKKKQSKKRRRK